MYKILLTTVLLIQLSACGANLRDQHEPVHTKLSTSENPVPPSSNTLEGEWLKSCAKSDEGNFERARLRFNGNYYQLRTERYVDDQCLTPDETQDLAITSGSFAVSTVRSAGEQVRKIDMMQSKANGKTITRLLNGLLYVKNKTLRLLPKRTKDNAEESSKSEAVFVLQEAKNPAIAGLGNEIG